MATAPKPVVTLNISIGRTRERIGTPDKRMSEMVSRAILGDISEDGAEFTMRSMVDRTDLANKLRRTIETEYVKGVQYAVSGMIGTTSPGGVRDGVTMHSSAYKTFRTLGRPIDTESRGFTQLLDNGRTQDLIKRPNGPLRWQALSRHTRERKKHNRFFEDTGALSKMLRSKALNIVRKTGVVRVVVTTKQRRDSRGRFLPNERVMPIANLEIRLMPSIPRSMLPGLTANNFGVVDRNQAFEKAVIADELALRKLAGPERRKDIQRPLLQPIFTYWTNYYVPARIAQILRGRRYSSGGSGGRV